jgi:hypothetical protein
MVHFMAHSSRSGTAILCDSESPDSESTAMDILGPRTTLHSAGAVGGRAAEPAPSLNSEVPRTPEPHSRSYLGSSKRLSSLNGLK